MNRQQLDAHEAPWPYPALPPNYVPGIRVLVSLDQPWIEETLWEAAHRRGALPGMDTNPLITGWRTDAPAGTIPAR